MSRFVRSNSIVLSAIGAALALLIAAACETTPPPPPPQDSGTPSPSPTQQQGGDEDRPPVIISGGSIHLRMVARDRGKGKNQDHGDWVLKSGIWHQDHSMQKAKKLFVNVLNGSGSADCQNPEKNFDVTKLEIAFTARSGDGTFKIYLDTPDRNGRAELLTDAKATKDAKIPFWLALSDPSAELKSVTFPDLRVTCGLTQAISQVHVYPTSNKDAQ